MKACIIDVETTGNEPDEVIELAMASIEGEQSEVFQTLNCRYGSRHGISFGAMAVHHILPSDIAGLDPFSPSDLSPWWETHGYVIGHNVDFDWQAIGSPPVKRICTLALARLAYPDAKRHNLSALYYMLRGATDEVRKVVQGAHGAWNDVAMTAMLLRENIIPELGLQGCSFEELWQASERGRVPTRMPFGKHRGELIASMPRGYKDWLLGQPDVEPYLAKALRS